MEYDVTVIGGGPAGLAATCYALQAQLKVALVSPTLGGKVGYPFQLRGLPAVDNVRGADLVQQFEDYVEVKLTSFLPQEARRIIQLRNGTFQLSMEDSELISTRSIILCTGAQPQRLYVPGEHEFMGRGLSYSAISHAQFFRKRTVAVVGGVRALHAVVKMASIANRVYYILANSREIKDVAIAEQILNNPKISIFHDWEVQEILGDSFVTAISLVATNGETRTLSIDGAFIELGLLPNNELAYDLVELDEEGRVTVDHHCQTSVPGIFAAGDVTNVYAEQVPVAIGEGVKAALSAWSYLSLQTHQSSYPTPIDARLG